MTVTFVGSGNVATQMAKAFKRAGFTINQVCSRNIEHACALAEQVGATAINDAAQITPADLYVIAVKDDEISAVADNTLQHVEGVAVHTSGATAINILEKKSNGYGVFYPLQTFSKEKAIDFKDVPLCIEGCDPDTEAMLLDIAGRLSNRVYLVDSNARRILHLAAVFACNFTNHLYALSEQLVREHGLDFELLRPLIKETADKVQNALPNDVQTGPAVRSDEQTMASHMALLENDPQLRDLYQILSNSIKKTNR